MPAKFGASRGRLTVAKLYGSEILLRFDPGADVIAEEIDRRIARLRDLRPVFDEYGAYLVEEHIPLQFKLEGQPQRWARLSERYARYKKKYYGNAEILVISGAMKRGFKHQTFKRSMRIVNPDKKWFYHQFGTGTIPARPMVQVRDTDRRMLRGLLIQYVQSGKVK